jgi:hypothetical protein
MNTVTQGIIAAAVGTGMMIVYDVAKDYMHRPAKVTAEATSTPYFSLIPKDDQASTFTRDLTSLRFPPQFDKDLQQRLLTRGALYDNAAMTARAECVHQVTVTNSTPKPVKKITVTAQLLAGYGYVGGPVTAGVDPAPIIEKLIPGASATVLLFSVMPCTFASRDDIRVFNDDDSADVEVTGPLPFLVTLLARNWVYVLSGIIVFIVMGAISDGAQKEEMKKLKAELAQYKPPTDAAAATSITPAPTTSMPS